MKKTVLLIALFIGLAWGQDCTADDGTEGVELWGVCYSIENTTELNLSISGLTGSIPPEIGNLTNLTNLILHNNQLTGSIPSEIGNLTNLTELVLFNNQLTGSIPPEIGNLTNLVSLSFYNNQLTGEIPPEIGELTNLISLILKENQLIGEIPSEISYLTNLTNLDLGGNQLNGAIPLEIGYLTNLNILDLAGNQLTGALPPEIGNLANLTELELGGNQVMGAIPPEIGNLESLTFIHLEYNQFTSEIPAEIGNLTNLVWLNFVHNQLTGEIPSSICNLDMNWSNPDNFNIYNNQLCPPYPSCIEDYVGEQDTSNCGQNNIEVVFQSDWNLVGLPLEVEDASYSNLFPESINGTLYSFGEGYLLDSTLVQGEGYWLRFNEVGSTTISGTPINELTISLNEGWNLVSGLSEDISIYSVSDPDSIIIPGTLYGFNEGYLETDLFVPGKGYWLRANNSGNIILITE